MNRWPRIARVLPVFLFLAAASFLPSVHQALGASNFGEPVSGQHIYDKAGVLTPAEMNSLETHARAVEAAGAPVVVYLQARDASYNATEQDARDLMNQWDVQSATNAHDGLVIFFNLKPNDLQHGQVALFAGAKHYNGGNLPESELQRIFDQDMKPDLAKGDLAQGIAAGLDAAANSLRNGPPPPPEPTAVQKAAANVSRGPFSLVNALALLLTVVFVWFVRGVWRTRPRTIVPIAATTSLPDATSPAVVGAVVTGRLRDDQLEATILDLAHRGALVIDSNGKNNPQVKLLDGSVPNTETEREVWHSLEVHADDEGVVTKSNLARTRTSWSAARSALRRQLVESGLYDPTAASRRRPVYVASLGMLLAGGLAVVVTAVGKQPWGAVGATMLFVAGMAGFITMFMYPDTSAAGADLAAKWRSYIAGIKRVKSDRTLDVTLELDEAMPYAVATGVVSALSRRLKDAAEQGYAPVWLGPAMYRNGSAANAFICWTAFHTAVTPSSSGTPGAGGAAAGGGGAGGSF